VTARVVHEFEGASLKAHVQVSGETDGNRKVLGRSPRLSLMGKLLPVSSGLRRENSRTGGFGIAAQYGTVLNTRSSLV
jgi:hypothetical protein